MSERSIYMDNNATTKVDPEVKKAVLDSLDLYGNASSMHGPGRVASAAVEKARSAMARLIGADPDEVIFTSGGSESNNTVIDLVFSRKFAASGRRRIVSSTIEHPSIYETVSSFLENG